MLKPMKPACSEAPVTRSARPYSSALAKKAAKRDEPAPAKAPAKAVPSGKHSGLAVPRDAVSLGDFERALGLFQARDWRGAAKVLDRVVDGHDPAVMPEIVDRSKMYLRICQRNQLPAEVEPTTGEQIYLTGVLRMNEGNLDQALALFERGTALDPGGDRAHYAAAATLALKQDRAAAIERLRRAIAINPDNRILAANDSDLESLRDEGEFQALIGSPRKRRTKIRVQGGDESE